MEKKNTNKTNGKTNNSGKIKKNSVGVGGGSNNQTRHNNNNSNKEGEKRKPNFLIFIVDEERYPPVYESEALAQWKEKYLKFQREFGSLSTIFENHYTNSTACAPARATIHTGQYPMVTGVTQTDGIAKMADDPDMKWMAENSTPTIGNYLREAGYDTFLKGKWHVSDAGIRYPDGQYMNTFDEDGNPLPDLEAIYLKDNPLGSYGYDGWIGPEPHGNLPQNSASSVPKPKRGRDVGYTEQVLEQLQSLENSDRPWLVVASWVNPHDITLYGLLANNPRSGFEFAIDNTLPKQLFREEFIASANEDLWKKPRAQLLYQQLYAKGLQPILDMDRYHRFYYSAQRYVDENIMRVWQYLKQSNAYDNTIVMFLSDHGDMLGSHGGQFQKWYNAYEESIHVPFMVSNPQKRVINNNAGGNRGGIVRRHKSVHQLTSHIDILPTILGLAGIDQEAIRHQLLAEFQYALPLPGNDLSSIVCAKRPPKVHEHCQSVYFYTEDDPFSGENQVNFLCESYQSVASPNHVEAIIANFDEKFWKLTHYYGDRCGENQSYGSGVVEELYDLDEDPEELYNLTLVKRAKQVKTYLVDLLYRYSFQYRGATQTPPNLRLPSV